MGSRHFKGLPFKNWPARDQELWRQGTRAGNLLDDRGPGAHWRPATIASVAAAYCMALGWLKLTEALDAEAAPELRWTADRLRAYISDMQRRLSPVTVRHRIVNVERALAILAPSSDRGMFRLAARNLKRMPDHAAKRARLQDPEDLVELGFRLMAEADADARTNVRHTATKFRTGLQIALLAMRPLRMRNFTNIRIGLNLVREGAAWWLRFDANETKTKQVIDEPFPLDLYLQLGRYLSVYRPMLTAGRYTGDRLWVGYRFGPESQHLLQLDITCATKRAFGNSVNPHLFRDCAATAAATHDPKCGWLGAGVLGHKDSVTTERNYNLATSTDAGRSYAAVIQSRRRRRHQRIG
jgi:integrase/recombinase XerD